MYNRDSKIMRKLLGKTAADSSTGDLGSIATSSAPVAPAYRPSKSQNGVYPAGVPISRFDVSPDRRAAVLGGSHILKTVLVDARGGAGGARFSLTDGIDVRAVIASRQSSNLRSSVVADQLNIRDVKWHDHSTIFTACASGKIFAYDLTRLSAGAAEPLEYIQMHEDSRQVNTLDVNPHLKSWLLSGSQDGTARVFDTSTPLQNRSGLLTFRQRFAPLRCIDSVRQVKWSPKVGHEMACCTEAGVVLKWDVRHPARPLLRINAHEKACSAIAWHPDGVHLMSAGWDTKVHIWDFSGTADKRQKPKWTISTPAPVSAVAWRPGLWSATTQTRRAAQVAVAYDETTNRRYGSSAVHIWDLARPTMPYKEIERFESSPTALMWQDQDLLWTVGQDGLFNQCDVAFAPKVLDRQSTSSMAFSSRGDVLMFLDERPQSHRPRPSTVAHEPDVSHRQTYSASPNTPMLSVSRSDSEEEVMGTFLGPRRRMIGNRRPSGRAGVPLSTTPPSGPAFPDDPKQTLNLDQSVAVTGVFKSQQAMASGRLPSVKPVQIYQYLSSTYLETMEKELPYVDGGKTLVQRVGDIMEHFAKAAENASLYRLAQTWRILAYAMTLLLNRRAQYHLERRVGQFQKAPSDEAKGGARLLTSDGVAANLGDGEHTPRRPSTQRGSIDGRVPSRSLLAEEIESTSNVPTPVARPVDAVIDVIAENEARAYQYGRRLTPIVEPESLNLGPAIHGSYRTDISPGQRLGASPAPGSSHDGSEQAHFSSTEGYDFYDTEVLAKAIDVPMPKKGSQGQANRGRDQRHDSQGSIGNMFSVSDGTKRSTARSSSSGGAFAQPGLVQQMTDTDRSSLASSIEYDSRIRGETLRHAERPDAPSSYTGIKSAQRGADGNSPDEVFMISQTTDRSDDSQPLQLTDTHGSQGDPTHDASTSTGMEITQGPSPPSKPASTMTSPRHDPRPHIIESDYLPWEDDPPYPHPLQPERPRTGTAPPPPPPPPSPLDPITLLTRALSFETRQSALNSSAMVLLLKPLVPASVIDEHQARAILRQQHSRLMRMSLFVEAALLRNLCVRGWPAGLPEWGDNHTAVFAPAQQGVKVAFFCLGCRKPREVDRSAGGDDAAWTCERCRRVMAPCAVCGHRAPERAAQIPAEIIDPDPMTGPWLSEWWCCPGCSHGGHASCLQTWHAAIAAEDHGAFGGSSKFSDGCCPLDGCGHACLPGKYRRETMTARADELGRAVLDASRTRADDGATRSASGPSISTPPPPPPPPLPPPSSAPPSSNSHHSGPPISPLSAVPPYHHLPRQRTPSGGHRVGSRRSSPQLSTSAVRGDEHDVPQSRAVGVAREALARGGAGAGSGVPSSPLGPTAVAPGGGILSSSPSGRAASATGERERRKSVKFARPERG